MVSLSLGFTPKRDQVRSTSSGTASDQGSATSFGIKINAVEGLTIAGGATSENSDAVTNSDPKGSTLGFLTNWKFHQLVTKRSRMILMLLTQHQIQLKLKKVVAFHQTMHLQLVYTELTWHTFKIQLMTMV